MTGLDDSAEEVGAAIAAAGGCSVKVAVGKINSPAGRLDSVWAKCPVAAAKKVVDSLRSTHRRVKVRVEALGARSLQCFKCLGRVTRGPSVKGLSYRCGSPGHKAAGCSAKPCLYCAGQGEAPVRREGMCLSPTGKEDQERGREEDFSRPERVKRGLLRRFLNGPLTSC